MANVAKTVLASLDAEISALRGKLQKMESVRAQVAKALGGAAKVGRPKGKVGRPKGKKRKMSAAGLAAIVAAQKKRWAAVRAKKATKAAK